MEQPQVNVVHAGAALFGTRSPEKPGLACLGGHAQEDWTPSSQTAVVKIQM